MHEHHGPTLPTHAGTLIWRGVDGDDDYVALTRSDRLQRVWLFHDGEWHEYHDAEMFSHVFQAWAQHEAARADRATLAAQEERAQREKAEGEIARARKACFLSDRDGPLDVALPKAIGWEPTAYGLANPIDGRPSEWLSAYERECQAHKETRTHVAKAEADRAAWRRERAGLQVDLETTCKRLDTVIRERDVAIASAEKAEKTLAEVRADGDAIAARLEEGIALVEALSAERDVLVAEREEARNWVRRLTQAQRVLTCAFCGDVYPPNTPSTNDDALTAHVKTCAKHPMREVEARADRAEKLAAAWDRVYRTRDAYHQHSRTSEWDAFEAALRALKEAGGPDLRTEEERDS